MPRSIARLTTDHASTYLQQLCKHFAHKLPVEATAEAGRITFTIGTCRLSASDGLLTLRAEAENAARLADLQDVVARHLLRFAFRDPPVIEWHADDEE